MAPADHSTDCPPLYHKTCCLLSRTLEHHSLDVATLLNAHRALYPWLLVRYSHSLTACRSYGSSFSFFSLNLCVVQHCAMGLEKDNETILREYELTG